MNCGAVLAAKSLGLERIEPRPWLELPDRLGAHSACCLMGTVGAVSHQGFFPSTGRPDCCWGQARLVSGRTGRSFSWIKAAVSTHFPRGAVTVRVELFVSPLLPPPLGKFSRNLWVFAAWFLCVVTWYVQMSATGD